MKISPLRSHKNHMEALAGEVQLAGCCAMHQKVLGLTPSQGTPRLWAQSPLQACERQSIDVTLSY